MFDVRRLIEVKTLASGNDDHTRQPRSTTHMDRFCKELFKIYLRECEEAHELIKQENE